MSLFVNPTQFGANEDLGAYPRDEERDAALAAAAGADILFAPPVEEIYPDGFATSIHVSGITEVLCGAHRGPAPLRRRRDGRREAVPDRRPRRRLLRAEGCAAGPGDPPPRPRPRHPGAHRRLPDRARTGRAGDELPQRLPRPRVPPAGDGAESRTGCRRRRRSRRGETDAGAVLDAARAVLTGAGIDPEYLELRSPDDLRELDAVDRPGAARGRRARRSGATHRQPNPGADAMSTRPVSPRRTDRTPARHDREPRRAEGERRADRDGHRVRLPQRADRRGRRRRRRAGRRLRRDDRARPREHGARHGRRDADAHRRRAPGLLHPAPGRRPAVRLVRGLRRAGRRAPRSGSSRPPGATPSRSSAAARRSTAPARSSPPASP